MTPGRLFIFLAAAVCVGNAAKSHSHSSVLLANAERGKESAIAFFVTVERSQRMALKTRAYDHALRLSLESLNRTGSKLQRVALTTHDISTKAVELLSLYGVERRVVEPVDSPDAPEFWCVPQDFGLLLCVVVASLFCSVLLPHIGNAPSPRPACDESLILFVCLYQEGSVYKAFHLEPDSV